MANSKTDSVISEIETLIKHQLFIDNDPKTLIMEYFKTYENEFKKISTPVLEFLKFIFNEVQVQQTSNTIFLNELMSMILNRYIYNEDWVSLNRIKRDIFQCILSSTKNKPEMIKNKIEDSIKLQIQFDGFSTKEQQDAVDHIISKRKTKIDA
jgi:hypothetical protein